MLKKVSFYFTTFSFNKVCTKKVSHSIFGAWLSILISKNQSSPHLEAIIGVEIASFLCRQHTYLHQPRNCFLFLKLKKGCPSCLIRSRLFHVLNLFLHFIDFKQYHQVSGKELQIPFTRMSNSVQFVLIIFVTININAYGEYLFKYF